MPVQERRPLSAEVRDKSGEVRIQVPGLLWVPILEPRKSGGSDNPGKTPENAGTNLDRHPGGSPGFKVLTNPHRGLTPCP